MAKGELRALEARIEAAFGGLPHPGDGGLLHSGCHDDGDIQAFYGDLDWRDVPDATLERESAALSFFSPAAFRYYLPAFLRWTARNLRTDSNTVDAVLYALAPERGDLREFAESKHAALDVAQAAAVVAFLERALEVGGEDHLDAAAARRALRHWRGRAGRGAS